MDVKELTKVGKRCFPILLILIILCTSVSASYWNFLTIGQGDQRYCLRNGPCELSSLIVDTINVTGTLFVDIISKRNVTRESITITDNLTFDGGDLFFKDGVIENPNALGTSCNYIEEGIDLGGMESRFGLPTFIQSYFSANITYQNECFGDTTFFDITTSDPIQSITWDFGDPASGSNNTSTELQDFSSFNSK